MKLVHSAPHSLIVHPDALGAWVDAVFQPAQRVGTDLSLTCAARRLRANASADFDRLSEDWPLTLRAHNPYVALRWVSDGAPAPEDLPWASAHRVRLVRRPAPERPQVFVISSAGGDRDPVERTHMLGPERTVLHGEGEAIGRVAAQVTELLRQRCARIALVTSQPDSFATDLGWDRVPLHLFTHREPLSLRAWSSVALTQAWRR
jgi:hypothetical protein